MDLLWCDFINTEWRDWRGGSRHQEKLSDEPHMKRLLDKWGLDAPLPLAGEELAALQEFRAALRRMAEAVSQGLVLDTADVELLNRCLSSGPTVRRFAVEAGEKDAAVYRLETRPAGSGWEQAAAEVAASFAGTLAERDPARIRICGNADCGWVFYDDTRSRTKRYCEDSACGNLMKVRRFRSKRKREGTPEADS